MLRPMRLLVIALALTIPLIAGGCFHHRHGNCGQPCQMQQRACESCAKHCQTPCPNCPCQAAPAQAPAK